jgi:hypothetical protein
MDEDEKADLKRRFGNGVWYAVSITLTGDLQPSREKSLVLTKLEEAQSWAQRAVKAQS